jgi:Bacterial RNA polymerase, alpha chain C terminal domain
VTDRTDALEAEIADYLESTDEQDVSDVNVARGIVHVVTEAGWRHKKELSDGRHTFADLYDHRYALFAALCACLPMMAWKSWQHGDGTAMFNDSFIVGLDLPSGQITYHLPASDWDRFPATVLDVSPDYDGHTPADVVERLWAAVGPVGADVVPRPDLDILDLPTRLTVRLNRAGIRTVDDLTALTYNDLCDIRRIGVKSVALIDSALAARGLELAVERP